MEANALRNAHRQTGQTPEFAVVGLRLDEELVFFFSRG
jgi:hypothetical protein